MERGRVDRCTLATTRRVLRALDATVELFAVWGGQGDLERLFDADHARLVEAWADRHRRCGWELWPEASFSVYGERGRIDLLAFHPPTGMLEVAECKTGIVNVQDTAGRLDAKVRLAPDLAKQKGWRVERVVGALVIADTRTARRRVADHPLAFARYDTRGFAANAFVRDPTGSPSGLLTFVPLNASEGSHKRAGQQRVRRSAST